MHNRLPGYKKFLVLVQTSAFIKELYVYVVDCDIGAIWIAKDVGYVGVE